MNKVAVYTVNIGNYDDLKPIRNERGFDYFVFTDDKDLNVPGWQTVVIENGDVWKQREIKLLPHKYLHKYKATIYLDANMHVKRSVNDLFRYFDGRMILIKHPSRNCVYKESAEILKQGKAEKKAIDKHVKEYRKRKFPANYGMWSTGFMIRANTTEQNEFNELWHGELAKHTHRDQMAIPYALKETGIQFKSIHYNYLTRSVKISPHKHQSAKPKEVKVFYSSPFRSDKNIGKANNDFINLLPDDAWICITDADAMFLLPDYGTHIENIIKEHGAEFGLIGCVTNRLRGLHQLYNNEFSDDMDVRNHYVISRGLKDDHENEVMETSGVAGLCMIFSKRMWVEVGGFREGTITADTYFNKAVKRKGKKVGLAKGLYMMHAYRIWEKTHLKAANSTAHLL